MDRLFVYGTLSPGGDNHHLLSSISGSWEVATLTGRLLNEGWGAELGCPGMILSDSGEEIAGWVFASKDLSDHWSMLDEFEGADYQRILTHAKVAGGERLQAYVYVLNVKKRSY